MKASAPAADQVNDGLVECRICGAGFRSLGHHVGRAHGISVAEYRAANGIRPGVPLTSPATRQKMSQAIRRTIASGALDGHFEGNGARAGAAGELGQAKLLELRTAGVALPTAQPVTPRAVIEAIVVEIEGGSTVAGAVRWSPIAATTFHAGLARHPDLKARVAAVSRPAPRRGRIAATELARIMAAIERAYPKASLMYARIVVALMDAPDRTLPMSDLSEVLGKGRDATSVQDAVTRLASIDVVGREMIPASGLSGRYWSVQLCRHGKPR